MRVARLSTKSNNTSVIVTVSNAQIAILKHHCPPKGNKQLTSRARAKKIQDEPETSCGAKSKEVL